MRLVMDFAYKVMIFAMRKIMEWSYKVADGANVAAAVLVGLYLVLLSVLGVGTGLPQWLISSPTVSFIVFFVGASLVTINVCVLAQDLKTVGLKRNLRIPTEQGKSELSVAALEMLLLRDLKAEPDVIDPVLSLTPRGEGKPMLCEVEMKLRRQQYVNKRTDALARKIRDTIDKLISGGLTLEVQIDVRDFVNSPAASGHDQIGPADEFNGPVFPDSGGSDNSV